MSSQYINVYNGDMLDHLVAEVPVHYGWRYSKYISALELLCVDAIMHNDKYKICNLLRTILGYKRMTILECDIDKYIDKYKNINNDKNTNDKKSTSVELASVMNILYTNSSSLKVEHLTRSDHYMDLHEQVIETNIPIISNDLSRSGLEIPKSLTRRHNRLVVVPLYDNKGKMVILVGASHKTITANAIHRIYSMKNIIYILLEHCKCEDTQLKQLSQKYINIVLNMVAPLNKLYTELKRNTINIKDVEDLISKILREINTILDFHNTLARSTDGEKNL